MDSSTLTKALEKLVEFLDSDGSILFDSSQISASKEQAIDLLVKARQSRSSIVIGIVGGTGVGKSTLINALALDEISLSSYRRPFTDRAVIYRHHETETSFDWDQESFRQPDATHNLDSIRDLILIDMPDFDSHNKKNEQTTLKLLPYLDMIVWVVSPEKYADASFFDFIRNCNSHQSNFSFVFNKSDQLFDDMSPDNYSRLKEALGDLIFHLKTEVGIDNPRVFSLSSYHEFSRSLQDKFLVDEFNRFREFIMAKRSAKEVESIKFLNLLNQSRDLFNSIYDEAKPDSKRQAIQSLIEVNKEQYDSKPLFSEEFTRQEISSAIFQQLVSSDNSIQTVKMAMRLFSGQFRDKSVAVHYDRMLAQVKDALASLSNRWLEKVCRIEGKINSEAMLSSLKRINETKPDDFVAANSHLVDQSLAILYKNRSSGLKKVISNISRMLQMLVLSVPVGLIIVRLSGQELIYKIFDELDFKGSLWALINLSSRLIGPEGLASIMSVIIVELVLIAWLANRRIKKLRKMSLKLTTYILNNFERAVEDQAKKVTQSVNQSLERISNSLNKLYTIKQLFCSKAQS